MSKFHKISVCIKKLLQMLRSAIISGKVTCLVVPGRCFHRFLLLFEGQRSYFWSYRYPFLNVGKKLRQFFCDYQALKKTRKLRDWEFIAHLTQSNCSKIGLIFCQSLKMGTYSSKNKIFGLQKAIETYENTSLAPPDM